MMKKSSMPKSNFDYTFNEKLPVIGMIHLSSPNLMIDEVTKRAIEEIDILEKLGYAGALVENYHSNWKKMEPVLKETKNRKIRIGVNVLEKDLVHEDAMKKAFEFTEKYNVKFIQFDYISGSYEGGYYFHEDIYRKLRSANPNITIIGGVHPKYYEPLTDLESDILEGMKRADAVAVTGQGTGIETPLEKILDFKNVTRGFPIIVAAGLTPKNVYSQLKYADGAIVGSCIKPFSDTNAPINEKLASDFMDAVKKVRLDKYKQ